MRSVQVPPSLLTLAASQSGLLAPFQCEASGLRAHSRRRLIDAGRWNRLSGRVLDTGTAVDDGWEAQRAHTFWLGMLAAGPDAVAVGLGALWWHGVWGVPVDRTPEAGLPFGRGNDGPDGAVVRRFADPFDVIDVRGVRTVPVPVALIQALPEVPPRTAVSLVDSALQRRLLHPDELDDVRDGLRGRRGAATTDSWWSRIDGRAESPLETFARLDCEDDGLPPDTLQLEVVDAHGRFVGRGDLAWRGRQRWVIAEMDGIDEHSSPRPLFEDRGRQNRLQSGAGVLVLRFTGPDVRRRGSIARDVRRALAAS